MWREPARHAGFLSLEGVGVTRHQVRNWTGSGKITCWISGGTQHFSSENLKEVAKLWIESNGRWRTLYSVYSGMITAEYLNSAQCAGLWACSDRQAKRTIDSGILVGIKVGNGVGGKPCPGSPASLQRLAGQMSGNRKQDLRLTPVRTSLSFGYRSSATDVANS